ncbi:MAG: DUF2281 domain-containing protein [Cyanobacteria bacterium J06581_3]
MTLKEKLLQELETLEEADLQKVLELVRSLGVSRGESLSASKGESLQAQPPTAWEAYTASKKERERVSSPCRVIDFCR